MRKLIIAAALVFVAATALAIALPRKYISTQTISNPTTTQAFSVPSDADYAIVSIRTAGVHVSYNGAATTSNTYYAPGMYVFENQTALLSTVQVINSSDGSAVVQIDYFGRRTSNP